MPNPDYSNQLSEVTFRCGPCKRTFSAAPGRVEENPACDWHPWSYFAVCTDCGEEAPQAPWEKSLLKAWQNATGPRTAEGKAATAANLVGHPTPEEAQRTRFNAMKHGLSAKTATYFPARPGKYAFCDSCNVDREWCGQQPACQKRTELFMMHHAAFESRNPRHLAAIYADLQAALLAVVQQILQTIIKDGVKIEAPQYINYEGEVIFVKYTDPVTGQESVIQDIQAHPLFKPLGELISKNGLSLADMGMTAKAIEDEQIEFGRLKAQEDNREALGDFARQQAKALSDLGGMLARAAERRDRDPVLLEYQQQNGSST